MSLEPGQEIGKYKILSLLGEGGFGAVYKAEHTLMRRFCAIKTLHKSMATDERVAGRFKREGQVAARFKHPNAIEVYDFDRLPDGGFYIAMEFLTGETLRDRLERESALPLGVAIEVIVQVLAALSAAHKGGVVHRDLKPENVFLEKREDSPHFVKVLDFGIAKLREISQGGDPGGAGPSGGTVKTMQGDFFGTPRYASPEQCLGSEIDARSDLYSAGIMFYEMLTGKLPFTSNTPSGYIAQHLYVPPPPIRQARPELPEEIEPILQKALAKKPEERYKHAGEMIDAIRDAAQKLQLSVAISQASLQVKTPGASTLRRMGVGPKSRAPLFAGILGAVALASAAAFFFAKQPKKPGPPGRLDPAALAAQAKSEAAALERAVERDIEEKKFRSALERLAGKRSTAEAPWIDERAAALQGKLQKLDREAREKVKAAREALAANPLAFSDAINALNAVAADYKDTDAGDEAANEAKRLADAREAAAEKLFSELKAQADKLAAAGDYDAAIQKLDDFPAAFTKTLVNDRVKELREDLKRQAAANPLSERKAAKEREEAEAALAASPQAFGAAIARMEGIARKYPGTKSGEEAGRRAAELKEKREAVAAAEWATRKAQKSELAAAGKFDEAVRVCASFPDALAPSHGRVEADQALEEVKTLAQTQETDAHAKADALRAEGRVREALKLLEPFAALREPQLAGPRADAEAAVASLQKIAPLHDDMALIAAGTYAIGSDQRPIERPPHQVELKAFLIDKHEVTNAQYADFLDDAGGQLSPPLAPPKHWPGARPAPGDERLPVVNVTELEAAAFCRWAGKRLPTEEEWEAAARGPSGAMFPWGAQKWDPQAEPRRALIQRTAGERKGPVAVDSPDFEDVTPLGVVGLAGNVSEWTSSIFRVYEGNKNPPKDPGQGVYGVARGGNFTLPIPAPASYRYALDRSSAASSVGFRAAKDAR